MAEWERCIASTPTKGRLLLATPPLEDPNFDRTVIYVLEHHDEGALGLVLNRPSPEELGDALRRVDGRSRATRRSSSSAARSSPMR